MNTHEYTKGAAARLRPSYIQLCCFSLVKTAAVIRAVSGMDRITPTLLAMPLTTSMDTYA